MTLSWRSFSRYTPGPLGIVARRSTSARTRSSSPPVARAMVVTSLGRGVRSWCDPLPTESTGIGLRRHHAEQHAFELTHAVAQRGGLLELERPRRFAHVLAEPSDLPGQGRGVAR